MTPYLINHTWIDLDHIVAIEEGINYDTTRSQWVKGKVIVMFRDAPLEVIIGRIESRTNPTGSASPNHWTGIEEARMIWNRFIEVWKTRKDKSQS